jgi:SEC-C motif domain protein
MKTCPCGSTNPYTSCCGRFIEGGQAPETPEELMRSRYTAYTQARMRYIQKTMRGRALRGFDLESTGQWAASVTWTGLQIVQTETKQNLGWVEFIASYTEEGKPYQIHERSEFERLGGHWYYTRGTHLE